MYEVMEPVLADLTTIHLGGKALAMLCPQCHDDLPRATARAKELGGRLLPFGRGSNILACSGQLPYSLFSMLFFDSMNILVEDSEKVLLKVGAGVPLPRLLRFCLKHELSGLEGLVGIPGNVGGACAMNAGSFGCEFGRLIHAVDFWTGDDLVTVPAAGLEFSYRRMKVSGWAALPVVTGITFALTRAAKNVILDVMNLNFLEKKSKQPVTAWSAGCAFKNPGKGRPPAGKLLEDAGFRGRKLGGMAFSQQHANFLVNEGNGTPEAALELLAEAEYAVKKNTGIDLELEIRVIK